MFSSTSVSVSLLSVDVWLLLCLRDIQSVKWAKHTHARLTRVSLLTKRDQRDADMTHIIGKKSCILQFDQFAAFGHCRLLCPPQQRAGPRAPLLLCPDAPRVSPWISVMPRKHACALSSAGVERTATDSLSATICRMAIKSS